ncbi:MAG: ABC transporter ATP-binding protein [Planctomycetes bacterium]|jgi:lipooligosaccharide transport system ATP-binding protein|nr:ABC transporter ATP-binding protein [Planctomycetota bacterium]
MSIAPLLDARGLVKSLGGKRVVDGVDLTCAPGEVLGLLGPNGAGKTTSLRMCYGFLRPDAGTISIAGHDLTSAPDAARQALGVCTQDDTFDADFSVRGNLEQTGRYYRPRIPDLKQRTDELLDQFGLKEYEHHMPEMLSGGYKRRLMIARAVLHRPKVVFLDEPTTGLDPQARVAVWELIASLRTQGMAVVLTTHYMDEAERLSDRLLVLQSGKVRAGGLAKHVLGDVVGEHVVVLPVNTMGAEGIQAWLTSRGLSASTVLANWHLPLDAAGLAAFVAAFPTLRYEVRIPTLDDLFLALAEEKSSGSRT